MNNQGQIIPEYIYNKIINVTSLSWWLTRNQIEWFPPLLWRGIKWSYLLVGLYHFAPELFNVMVWPIALMK